MCADGWFDLCTSAPGHPFAYAVAKATAELMVAAACLIIGLRTQQDARTGGHRMIFACRLGRRWRGRRAAASAGPGPDVARVGCASVGAGRGRAY